MVTISNDFLTVVIAEHGAEIQSVRGRDGHEYMWQGDPTFWASRAPIMFPICGGLKDDTYYLDGKPYHLTKHGFAKNCDWRIEEREPSSVLFSLGEKQAGFPFEYVFFAGYELQGDRLVITYTVKNLDERDFYFGIGSHEAYATPGGLEGCKVVFEQPERLERCTVYGNLIDPVPEVMAEQADELTLQTEYFAVDAMVFPNLLGHAVTLINANDPHTVHVEYPDVDVLMLWTKPGADYICIEPWSNAPDYTDTDMQIENKKGCIHLQPGEEKILVHSIRFA